MTHKDCWFLKSLAYNIVLCIAIYQSKTSILVLFLFFLWIRGLKGAAKIEGLFRPLGYASSRQLTKLGFSLPDII